MPTLFDIAVNASVAAIRAAAGPVLHRGSGPHGVAENRARVDRSDRLWAWASHRWGDRFIAAVGHQAFPAEGGRAEPGPFHRVTAPHRPEAPLVRNSDGTTPAVHVLVVEDDEPSRCLAERVLTQSGYRVTPQAWPDLTPAEVATLAPDVVVLDLMFGRAPLGLAFLEDLRAHPATAELPVMVYSADVFGIRAASDRLGTAACVTLIKPFRPSALLEAVARCLEAPVSAAATTREHAA